MDMNKKLVFLHSDKENGHRTHEKDVSLKMRRPLAPGPVHLSGKIVSLNAYAKLKGVELMNSEQQEIKLETFKPKDVCLFCEEMEDDNWTLKAFGMLLESSSLNKFAEDICDDAWLYRKGLRDIVELHLARQKRKLNEFSSKSVRTPEWLIEKTGSTYAMTMQGAWKTPEVALDKTIEGIQDMKIVLDVFGNGEYPRAQELLISLLDLQNSIKERIRAKTVEQVIRERAVKAAQEGE